MEYDAEFMKLLVKTYSRSRKAMLAFVAECFPPGARVRVGKLGTGTVAEKHYGTSDDSILVTLDSGSKQTRCFRVTSLAPIGPNVSAEEELATQTTVQSIGG